MNRLNKILLIVIPIILLFGIFLYFFYHASQYKNCVKVGNLTFCPLYSLNEINSIKIIGNESIYQLRFKYNYSAMIFNPIYAENFTLAIVNIQLKIPEMIPVCEYYYNGCIYYTNTTYPNQTFYIFEPDFQNKILYIYSVNASQIILVYIENSNQTLIKVEGNRIFLEGNESTIPLVAWKFILSWYNAS